MKNKIQGSLLFAIAAQFLVAIQTGFAAQTNIQSRADELLRSASTRIANAKSFTVSVEIWEDKVLDDQWKAQASRTVKVWVKRPNKLHSETRSAARNTDLFYDGKTISLLNRDKNLYGSVKAPDTLDKTVDFVFERFGINMPLTDLIVSDPYANAVQNVVSGRYLGPGIVEGKRCHHLAFIQDNVDWQMWIEDGSEPLIRKILITYKNDPQSPEFTALFNDWRFDEPIPDNVFDFNPPADAAKIPVAETKEQPLARPAATVEEPAGAQPSGKNENSTNRPTNRKD